MDLFMPAERVLYDRAYYLSDEAVDDYNEYIADRDGVNVDVVSSLDFFMNEVWKEIDYAIDNDLSDEISCFDRMLRDLKCGGDPEHPTEISVVAKGTVERWDEPSRGLVVADSLLSLVQGTGSADALKDCQIDRLVDTNGEFHIEASHHDGSANLDVRLISGVSYDAKGFKLGGEYYAPGKMDLVDFYILLDNLYDFYYADEPKPAPEFFIPPNRAPRPVVCLDTGETFESSFQAGRAFGITPGGVRTSASTGVERGGLHFYYGDEPKPAPEFFRERHSKTRPIVCLETGETFVGNPAAARPLHVSPTAISQAVRYGSPVNGLHFYHGDEPKPAPEFFKPAKVKGGKSPAAMAAAAKATAGNSAPGTDYREHGIQRDRRAVQ